MRTSASSASSVSRDRFTRHPSAPPRSAADSSPHAASTVAASCSRASSADGSLRAGHFRSTSSTAIAPQPCCCSTRCEFVSTSERCSATTAASTGFLSAPTSVRNSAGVDGPASRTASTISCWNGVSSGSPTAARAAGTSLGATSACQRPKCLPTQTRPRAGSSSFHAQQRDISGVNSSFPSDRSTAQSTSSVPETACQSDGRTTSETGSSEASPTRSTQRAPASIRRSGVLVDLRFVDEDTARLRSFIAADDASPLQHVDQTTGPPVADAQAPLQERDRRGLRLNDDLDRLVQERSVVRVELPGLGAVVLFREDFRELQVALVELLLALARLLDDERDLLLRDVRALHAL